AEDGIRAFHVTGVQACALPISVAMSLFIGGTTIAATAPVFGLLVLGRVVQASGTALMMPLMMTTVLTIVPMHLRGRIMGRISIEIGRASCRDGAQVQGGDVAQA